MLASFDILEVVSNLDLPNMVIWNKCGTFLVALCHADNWKDWIIASAAPVRLRES